MSVVSGYSKHQTTSKGTSYWYKDSHVGLVTMNAMVRVELAEQATQDSQTKRALAHLTDITPAPEIEPITISIIGAVIAGVGVAVGAAGAVAGAVSAGTNVAGLFSSKGDTRDTLEIVIKNRMAAPVTMVSFDADSASLAELCGPIAPGGSDTVVLGGPGKGAPFSEGESSLALDFLVGGGITEVDGTNVALECVSVTVKFSYNSDTDWVPSVAIDSSSQHSLDEDVGGIVYFEGKSGVNVLDFSVLATVANTANGSVTIEFLPPGSTLV